MMRKIDTIGRSALIVASVGLSLACTANQPASSASAPTPTPTASAVSAPPPVAPIATPAGPVNPVQPAQNASTPAPAQNPEDKMPRLSAEEAMKLVAAHKAVLIDVRGTQAYQEAHIKGALDFPGPRIEASDFKGLPRDKRIIAYCT